ncbi:MAG: UDP-N-acetylmuramoyl-L-alanine--D-glutamate ligase [Rhodospirillales bacterium]|nr:UDP-N-acetylmuramoyl-L-alanine--D-glutamate ligase [Rhodospirillales bacterium]
MMFRNDILAGRRYAVVGLGKAGLPAAVALAAMGAEVTAWDDREPARAAAAAAGLAVGEPSMAGLDALVLSPGIAHRPPKAHPLAAAALAAGVPILTDAELLYVAVRAMGSRARFAGITGTNGKSTTTALLAHMVATAGLPVAAGANLGPAALALPLLADAGIYVLEMSSYMLERIATLRFDAAVMLNLSPDHLDRHGDMAGYARAKRHIFDNQGEDDTAVVGIDDEASRAMAEELRGSRHVVTISGHAPADVWACGTMLRDREGDLLDLTGAPSLPGRHNAQNAAAACALATALGLPRAAIIEGLRSYPGLAHRQQLVARTGGVAFVNDSKATNADAVAYALACYDRLIWIAGGMAKEGGIESLAPLFGRIAHAFLIGRDAPLLAATLARHGVAFTEIGTLEAAVPAAYRAARRLDAPVVLLSPACASWDQFSGYDARGDRFAALARGLAATDGEAA